MLILVDVAIIYFLNSWFSFSAGTSSKVCKCKYFTVRTYKKCNKINHILNFKRYICLKTILISYFYSLLFKTQNAESRYRDGKSLRFNIDGRYKNNEVDNKNASELEKEAEEDTGDNDNKKKTQSNKKKKHYDQKYQSVWEEMPHGEKWMFNYGIAILYVHLYYLDVQL